MSSQPDRTPRSEPLEYDYGWNDWWKVSVTNRVLRVICTIAGGLLVAGFFIAGVYQSIGIEAGWFQTGVLAFGVLLAGCLVLDLRLAFSFKRFAARHQALLLVHLFVGQALGLFYAWSYGLPILRDMFWVSSIALGFLFVILALIAGILFTLCIGGPSRVSALCSMASIVLGAVDDGFGVLTRIEVWDLLIGVLPIDGGWLTWAWAIVLGLCWFYDRGGGFFEFVDL